MKEGITLLSDSFNVLQRNSLYFSVTLNEKTITSYNIINNIILQCYIHVILLIP